MRLKYIQTLKTTHRHLIDRKSFLEIPSAFLEEEQFIAFIPFDKDAKTGKHGSLTNIFSCWNGMIGTGLVTIPWAFSQSGLLLGLMLTFLAFVISFTTQYFVMKAAGDDIDYTETLKKTYGKKGWYFGMIVFIMNLFIPITIFFQLITQFLYPIILVVIELFTGQDKQIRFDIDFSQFSYSYTCLVTFAILFALTMRRDMTVFVKINMLGVIFILIIIMFTISVGIYALCTDEFKVVRTEADIHSPAEHTNYIVLFGSGYQHLMGILGGGYYLHNISLPIYRNSKKPENNVRDMFLGFLAVFLSYCVCGTLGYYGFSSIKMFDKDGQIS